MPEPRHNPRRAGYRPDVDGLRAVSILLVLGFHAFPSVVAGGFIGVDIFFVISGFLISGIILDDLRHSRFSFAGFYARRIRRIFPALLLVLAASFVFGWFALLTDEYKQLGKHMAGAAGFVLNFMLWDESGYFDHSALAKPLLHLWSLSVEEQFYLLWPLFLWFAWKRRLNLLAVTVALGALSFLLNLVMTFTDTAAAFYLPHSRFWELMAGSALAQVSTTGPGDKFRQSKLGTPMLEAIARVLPKKSSADFLSSTGLLLIAAGAIFVNEERAFPGWWAILPTLGAVCVIAAGSRAWFNRVILSSQVLVWLGLISFPLYLWHWPLLSFASILGNEFPSWQIRVLLVLLAIFLAWLTYLLIEVPVRFSQKTRVHARLLVGFMVAAGSAGLLCLAMDGWYHRSEPTFNDREVRSYRRGLEGKGIIDCKQDMNLTAKDFYCRKNDVTPAVAIIGDSHAEHLFYGFTHSRHALFNRAILMAQGRCLPTLGFDTGATGNSCVPQLEAAMRAIEATGSIQYVVIAGNKLLVEGDPARSLEGFRQSLDRLKKTHRKLIFLIDTPSLKPSSNPSKCEPQALWIRTALFDYPEFCKAATEEHLQPAPNYDRVVEQLRSEYPEVLFFDPQALFCNAGRCRLFENSRLLFGDFNHLSIYGSQLVVDALVDTLDKRKF